MRISEMLAILAFSPREDASEATNDRIQAKIDAVRAAAKRVQNDPMTCALDALDGRRVTKKERQG